MKIKHQKKVHSKFLRLITRDTQLCRTHSALSTADKTVCYSPVDRATNDLVVRISCGSYVTCFSQNMHIYRNHNRALPNCDTVRCRTYSTEPNCDSVRCRTYPTEPNCDRVRCRIYLTATMYTCHTNPTVIWHTSPTFHTNPTVTWPTEASRTVAETLDDRLIGL